MDGQLYRDMELRKLPPRFRTRISQLLDAGDDWKKLMSSIPSESNPSLPKYKSEHVLLIEQHAFAARRSCSEILLDEWATSGRRRPTTETLYNLLQECELFRAADYIALEVFEIPPPSRPMQGPARSVSDEFDPQPQVLHKSPNDDLIDLELKVRLSEDATSSMNTVAGSTRKLVDQLTEFENPRGNLLKFSIQTLKAATENFDTKYKIGSGSFGAVFKLRVPGTSSTLAMKLLHPSQSIAEGQFLTEVNVLSRYQHENLVSLVGYCACDLQFCLIYEYMAGGTLMDALACEVSQAALNWKTRVDVSHGVAKGIRYLHSALERPLIHRDIKSANILLDLYRRPKIGDFGLAKSFSNELQTSALASTIFGTSAYMAPEAFRGDISPKIDVFSFGVILLEVITGLPPYDEEREGNDIVTYLEESVEDNNILPWIDPKGGSIGKDAAVRLYRIAQDCLLDKKKRPTSDTLLQDLQSLVLHFA